MNLARIKFISLLILALCKVQTVSFYKLSTAFESGSEALSCMRRIQRFMFAYVLDFDIIARLIMSLLPHKGPYTLSMDRTNWQFGTTAINALVLGIQGFWGLQPLAIKAKYGADTYLLRKQSAVLS